MYVNIYCVHHNTQLFIFGFLLFAIFRQYIRNDMTSISVTQEEWLSLCPSYTGVRPDI